LASARLTDNELVELLLTARPDRQTHLEAELLRRASDPSRRAHLMRLLIARFQDADEYLGASAEVARHYFSRLRSLSKP
jgi:hypothetical protein